MSTNSILILGAGELGTATIDAVIAHPLYSSNSTSVTLLLRPSTILSPSSSKSAELSRFKSMSVSLIAADTDTASEGDLTELFKAFHTVIHASGMLSPDGTQQRITNAVLAAGVKLYLPWQFGVDYDMIGKEGGFGLFAEQYAIRQQLRAQSKTNWVIISNGIFMSFLFKKMWGVVTRLDGGRLKITALNSWDDLITATTAEDIGRCTAEVVLNDKEERNRSVYIAGDTLKYAEFANAVEETTGREVVREVWPLEELKQKAEAEPENKLRKYHVVFSEGKGLSWPKEQTWNAKRGMEMEGVRSWVRRNRL